MRRILLLQQLNSKDKAPIFGSPYLFLVKNYNVGSRYFDFHFKIDLGSVTSIERS